LIEQYPVEQRKSSYAMARCLADLLDLPLKLRKDRDREPLAGHVTHHTTVVVAAIFSGFVGGNCKNKDCFPEIFPYRCVGGNVRMPAVAISQLLRDVAIWLVSRVKPAKNF
jgi:hypothetical protein